MSRLKRQRLNADGQDRVTASDDNTLSSHQEREPQIVDIEQSKGRTGRSLFVRSLPSSANTQSLAVFFSQSFPIKHATVVVDPVTKKSKGYGFVTFTDVEDAQSAKETFNQSLFEGQKIKVEFAEPRHRQGIDDGFTYEATQESRISRQKAEVPQPLKLIVRNLPWTIKDSDQLAALFRSYGKVKHATMPKKKPGLSAGFGFVVLRGRKNADKALKSLNGKEIEGRTLAVDWAVEKDVWEYLQKENREPEAEAETIDEMTEGKDNENLEPEDMENMQDAETNQIGVSPSISGNDESATDGGSSLEGKEIHTTSESGSSTLFIRNLPFTCGDETLRDQFRLFGAVKYARVVIDPATQRSKGTGFVCFFQRSDADFCLRQAPRIEPVAASSNKGAGASSNKQSLLQDTSKDLPRRYTLEGRVLQVSRAIDRKEAIRLTYASNNSRDARDKDKRRLYLLSEGTIPSGSLLHRMLSATETKMREDSTKQRQSLIKGNPSLHLSLVRLSIRNIPRNITSKDLKGLAREAVVGFAKDVKSGMRRELTKEELARGGDELREAEKARKAKGKGIVRQAKVVYEGREGGKVSEESGAGRSRGYGFIEYSSHRWALMGLRWLNGHAVSPSKGTDTRPDIQERKKRLIVEFAIENAQVVGRRQEREAKARERSKRVSEKREEGQLTTLTPKTLSRDQTMAKQRRGTKGKPSANPNSTEQGNKAATHTSTEIPDKASKRQQIIGRKRMMRRQRNRPASG